MEKLKKQFSDVIGEQEWQLALYDLRGLATRVLADGDLEDPAVRDWLLRLLAVDSHSRALAERVTELQAIVHRQSDRGATAEALWQLLDDIDTADDQIKPDDLVGHRAFRRRVLDLSKQRHALLKSDGYTLTWPEGDSVPLAAPSRTVESLPSAQLLAIAKLFPESASFDAIISEIQRLQRADQNADHRCQFIDIQEDDPLIYDKYEDLKFCIQGELNGVAWETRHPAHIEILKQIRKLQSDLVAPLPLLLSCPVCHVRHIDVGEFAVKPHHTHACQGCGHVWRPAKEPTVGVQYLPGYKNAPRGQELVGKRVRVLAVRPDHDISDPAATHLVTRFDGPYFNESEERYEVLIGTYRLRLRREEFEAL